MVAMHARLALVASFALAGCKFPYPADVPGPGDDGGLDASADAGADAAVDADTRCEGDLYGFTISNLAPCDLPHATAPLDLTNVASIDTTNGTYLLVGGSSPHALPGTALVAQATGPMVRVASAISLLVPAADHVTITGDYPLLLAIRGDANVLGVLDLTPGTPTSAPSPLPAGRRQSCAVGSGTAGSGSDADGGGGGGGALGGAGGSGGAGTAGAASAGQAGVPLNTPTIAPLWGGCAGSNGAVLTNADTGGGAIQISTKGTLTIGGQIASGGGGGGGGGGAGGSGGGGGGGGGSGGYVLLEAGGQLRVDGSLSANGGGGGGGSSGGGAGDRGMSGLAGSAMRASGGAGVGGASGGRGGAGLVPAGEGGAPGATGGGGGGGAGLIWLRATSVVVAGITSPEPHRIAP